MSIIAVVETGVMLALPVIAPSINESLGALLDTALLSCVAAPLILWRVRAAVRRAGRVLKFDRPQQPWRLRLGTAAVVACGLVATGLLVRQERDGAMAEARARFDRLTERASREVQRRMNQSVSGLRGARGVYMASESVSRGEFEDFVKSRNLAQEFPGVLGIGFIERVQRSDLDAFVARERADGAPDFEVRAAPLPGEPLAAAQDLYIIKYIFPLERNRPAWGYDVGSEAVRRTALNAAIASGEPTITGKIRLVQDNLANCGFLYLLPVYRKGTNPTTPEERRVALVGLAYTPILLKEALRGLDTELEGQVELEIFDGPSTSVETMLVDQDGDLEGGSGEVEAGHYTTQMFVNRSEVQVGGRSWTMLAMSTPRFDASISRSMQEFIALCGIVGTLLLASVLWSAGRGRERAVEAARLMTAELHAATVTAERLAEIARRTSNAVVVADVRGKIEWVNEGFTRITGYTLEEVRGKTPGRVLQGPDTDKAEAQRVAGAVRRGEAVRSELVNYHKDGHRYVIDIEIAPLRDAEGNLSGFMGIQTDVTERRAAEQRVAESEERLRAVIETALDAVVSLDAMGRVIEWNRQAEAIFGYSEAEAKGRDLGGLIALNGMVEGVGAGIAGWMSGGDRNILGTRIEATARSKGGGTIVAEIAINPIHAASGLAYSAFLRDITPRKAAEAALASAREAAVSASRAKSEFLANMSHEIRTPLTAILGFADFLREDGDISMAPGQRVQAIDTILNAGQHLLTVINDILDLSKIEAGRVEVERVEIALPVVLRDVESMFRPRAEGKGVACIFELTGPIPDRIISDPTRLRQILMNLLGNATKFTEAGSVTVRTGTAERGGGTRLIVDVIDTGPGMSREQAARLFQVFSQADSTVTRKHGGTGLGLTICRRLAALMGGEVVLLWSEEGRGSCFRLDLPLEAAAGSGMVEKLAAVATRAGADAAAPIVLRGRILLVEDGVDNQRLISFHLRRGGATVDIAENGCVALEMIAAMQQRGERYALVLTDMQMPEMDGYTLARTLRERGDTTPIVALTAHAMASDRQRCIDSGCDGYLSKPIDKHLLLETCATWMSDGGAARAA